MSPLWPERLHVSLAPQEVALWRAPRPWGKPLPAGRLACRGEDAAQPWRPALAALAEALGGLARRGARLEVLLADAFVRYQLLPWQAGLLGEAEQRAYAAHHFRSVYGAAAEAWEIRWSEAPPPQASLACAVDRALVAALAELAANHSLRLASLTPRFVAAHDAARGQLGGRLVALAVAEPARISLGLADASGWRSLVSRAVAGAPGEPLDALLQQEALRLDLPVDDARLFLAGARGARWQPLALPAWLGAAA